MLVLVLARTNHDEVNEHPQAGDADENTSEHGVWCCFRVFFRAGTKVRTRNADALGEEPCAPMQGAGSVLYLAGPDADRRKGITDRRTGTPIP